MGDSLKKLVRFRMSINAFSVKKYNSRKPSSNLFLADDL